MKSASSNNNLQSVSTKHQTPDVLHTVPKLAAHKPDQILLLNDVFCYLSNEGQSPGNYIARKLDSRTEEINKRTEKESQEKS